MVEGAPDPPAPSPRDASPVGEGELLHLLLEQMPAILWTVDRDLRITTSLGSGLQSLGLESGQIVGSTLYEYLGTTDPGFEPLANHLEALKGEPVSYLSEWAGNFYQVRLQPLRGPDRAIIGVIGVSHDITERVQAERALQSSEEKFRQLADHVHEVFWLSDPRERTLLYVSPAYEQIWGRTAQELYENPQSFLDAVHPDDRARVESATERQTRGEATEIEYRIVRPDHVVRWIWDRGFPIRNESGEVTRLCGIAEDVSDRKRLQKKLESAQRLETAGKVAAQIAHDFNNLLAPLTAYPELLRADLPENHPARFLVAEMESAAHSIAEINQQLLTLGRRGHYNQESLDVNRLLGEILSRVATPAGITVHTEFASDLLPIRGGAPQLARAFTNLVTNGFESMTGDGGTLSIRTFMETQPPEDGESTTPVVVQVSDTGSGIDPEVVDRIYDPFFTTKRMDRKRGSGLGLTVVHGIVDDHGGTIQVTSRAEGTTFTLRFPADASEVPEETPPRSLAAGTERILIVDDDETQRRVATRVLERLGYRVVVARSGEDALNEIELAAFDLVILDMMMDGWDGTETYRRILEQRPGQRAIVLSGFAMTQRVREALDLGASAFLSKPLTAEDLADAVRETIDDGATP